MEKVNERAKLVNFKLGYNLLDESYIFGLRANKFTIKQIKKDMIDDLIDIKTKQPTKRLANLIKEILY